MEDQQAILSRLESFLAAVDPSVSDVAVTGYEPIAGGYSRLMARFDVKWRRDGRDETHSFILRGDPPPDREPFHTDRRTEWDLLSNLTAAGDVAVPAARYFCDGAHLGTPSIVMDFFPGLSLLAHLAGRQDVTAESARLAEVAAAIHRVDASALPASMARAADWESYLTERIGQWAGAEQADSESDPFLRYVGAWLDSHRPPAVPLTLIHGDFQSANLLVGPDGTWAVVDWEFARIGDPREDLGYFKAVASAAPPDVIGADEGAFCARYRKLTGLTDAQLNPVTLGYFTILGTVPILAQIVQQKAALARGEQHSITGYYLNNALTYAHMLQLTITERLEGAISQTEEM